MKRVIAHWTAGAGRASAKDKAHYHRLVEYDGTVVAGAEAVEDNIVTSDGDYAAHTLRLNTGSIGVAMCGMRYPYYATNGTHTCRGPDNAWGAAAGQMGRCAAALARRSPRGSIRR